MRPARLDGDPHGALEWWRVRDVDRPPPGRRMLFIDRMLAEHFARQLVADSAEQVLLEHWRDDELVAVRMVLRVSTN